MTSYEPLFLRYRPQSLADVLGQSSIKETLINAINNSKIVHAYLLTGPRGSGKTSTARILAKSLNCTAGLDGKSPTVEPCGKCESCVSITNSSSIDVTEIDAASHGRVEDARKLIDKVGFASVSGKYRVYIIDEVHMLTTAAFNALLKIIEEPPANVVFVLATTEVDKVPKTISSRCQQLRFKPISPLDCLERLEYVSAQESINIANEALKLIASHADGAMRDALSLLDQLSVFSEEDKTITEDKVLEIIGAIPSEDLEKLASNILSRNPNELISKLDDLLNKGKDSSSIVQELSGYFLEVLEEKNSEAPKEKFENILSILDNEKIENFEIVQILDSLTELEIRMKQSVQNKNLLKAWLIKVCHRADILVAKDLLERIKRLEEGAPRASSTSRSEPSPQQFKPSAPKIQSASPSQKSPETRVESIANKPSQSEATNGASSAHSGFLDYLSPGSKGMFISSQAQLVKVDSGTAYVQMPNKFSFLKTKLEARADEFLTAISKDAGTEITSFNIELTSLRGAESDAAISGKTAVVSPRLEKQTIPTKPLVEEANIAEQIPESPQASPGEACVKRPEPESFTGALQNINSTLTPQETKLNETVEAALTIFGGKEV